MNTDDTIRAIGSTAASIMKLGYRIESARNLRLYGRVRALLNEERELKSKLAVLSNQLEELEKGIVD